MNQLRSLLAEHASARLDHANAIGPADSRDANAAAIDRLMDWPEARHTQIDPRGPDGSDPLVGVSFRHSDLLVWRVYPRQVDGAKVSILPGGALLVETSLAPSRVNVSSRQSSPPGEKGVG